MSTNNKKHQSILDIAVVCKRLHDIHTKGAKDDNDENFINQFKSTYESFKEQFSDDNRTKQFLGDSFEIYIENLIKSYKDEVYIKSYN